MNLKPSPAEIAISAMLRTHHQNISNLLPGTDSDKYTAALVIQGVPPANLGLYRYAFGTCNSHAEVCDRVLEEHTENKRPLPAEFAVIVFGYCTEQSCACGGKARTITYVTSPKVFAAIL